MESTDSMASGDVEINAFFGFIANSTISKPSSITSSPVITIPRSVDSSMPMHLSLPDKASWATICLPTAGIILRIELTQVDCDMIGRLNIINTMLKQRTRIVELSNDIIHILVIPHGTPM